MYRVDRTELLATLAVAAPILYVILRVFVFG
jgi:hypothetical protein